MSRFVSNDESGYLKVILGCMFSGKTSELIKEYRKWNSCGFGCLMINHISDKRYSDSEEKTFSHDGIAVNSINVGNKLFEFFKKDSFISRYDVILINEGQFFEDLYCFTDHIVNNLNKKVFVCGLDGDFKRKKFGPLLDIIPLCDDLVKLNAICGRCKMNSGIFTHRLTYETEQTVIGSDNYIPLCRKCYNYLNV